MLELYFAELILELKWMLPLLSKLLFRDLHDLLEDREGISLAPSGAGYASAPWQIEVDAMTISKQKNFQQKIVKNLSLILNNSQELQWKCGLVNLASAIAEDLHCGSVWVEEVDC